MADTHEAVVKKLIDLYHMLVCHNGFGEMSVDIRILKRGQKEVILRCGKQEEWLFNWKHSEEADAEQPDPEPSTVARGPGKSRCHSLALALLGTVAAGCLSMRAHAHHPGISVHDNHNGTITIAAECSECHEPDGGEPVQIQAAIGGEVLWQGVLNDHGQIICPRPDQPFRVCIDPSSRHTSA
jgi:hypothetical protein